MFQKLLQGIIGQRTEQHQQDLYRDLIRHEARIGASVFGPIPAGHYREFFCLDRHTWIWHEEWQDVQGKRHVRTTRYDVRPDGLLKSQNGHYQQVSNEETERFKQAVRVYVDRVNQQLYNGAVAA